MAPIPCVCSRVTATGCPDQHPGAIHGELGGGARPPGVELVGEHLGPHQPEAAAGNEYVDKPLKVKVAIAR